MKTIKVRTKEQLQDAYNIRKEVFVKEQNVPLELEIDEYENDSTHFVLYDHETPVAAGRFRVLNGMGKVERICVLPSYRGTGSGKKIMIDIEQYAKDHNINELKLHAQTYAIPFYEKLGYVVISDEFLDAGIPHKAMKKTILDSVHSVI